MDFKDYINKYAIKEKGVSAMYKCKISGFLFSWEDSDMHFKYLIKKNLI